LLIYSFLMTLSSGILLHDQTSQSCFLNLLIQRHQFFVRPDPPDSIVIHWSIDFPRHFPLPCSKTSLVTGCETPGFRTIGNHWSNYCSVHSDFCVSCNCS
jgi:hypothetical protein